MTRETITQENARGYHVSLYKAQSASGKVRFLAEASFEDGEKFLIDHWNLSSLQRMIQEVMPVVQLARAWKEGSLRTLN